MIKNNEIKVKSFDIPQVKGDGKLKLHFKLMVCGASGTGKTTAFINYFKQAGYDDPMIFTRKILVSPSGTLNPETGMRADYKYEDFADEEYTQLNKTVLNQVLADQTERIVTHRRYLADKALWNKFIDKGLEGLSMHEQNYLLYELDAEEPKPPFGHEHYPTAVMVIDDCVSETDKKYISDFMSRSRHHNMSVVIICQHMCHLSRAGRKQLNALLMFNTKDEKLLGDLWEQQFAGIMTKDKFLDLFRSMDDKRDFLLIDYEANPKNMIRVGFNDYVPESYYKD